MNERRWKALEMKYLKIALVSAALGSLLMVGCSHKNAPPAKPMVIATTTHIESILESIARDHVSSTVLVQGGTCPGHFDIAPEHVVRLEKADMLIMHGWEQWAARAIEAADNEQLQVIKLTANGNAMIPEIHTSLAKEITKILCQMDSVNCTDYTSNLETHLQSVTDSVRTVKDLTSPLNNLPVVCSEQQEALLTWLGCSVVAKYGRPESMTPARLLHVAESAERAGVRVVVDNMQSGPEAGRALAEDIGAPHVALSNFPLNGSYEQTLLNNIRILLSAVNYDK
jgi:zinc transport system substrate-binding protein